MLLNAKTQLGIAVSDNDQMQAKIIDIQSKLIKDGGADFTQEEIQMGSDNLKELVLNNYRYTNNNYLIKGTAMEMAKKIKLDDSFDMTFLSNLPTKKATFLLGKELAFRYYKTQDTLHGVIYFLEGDIFSWVLFKVNLLTGDVVLPDVKGKDDVIPKNEIGFSQMDDVYESEQFKLFIQLLIFVELSELVIEVLPPNRTTGTKKSGKYFNQSRLDIAIVDSKWNITSIRNDGFLVNGFWRNQRYGKENRRVKYIFIAPFMKQGYIRKAKKSNLNL